VTYTLVGRDWPAAMTARMVITGDATVKKGD
jgi:hypothetical protein